MSFLGFGRQQPTSEQKIAAVEGEMRMMADTYNRFVSITCPIFRAIWASRTNGADGPSGHHATCFSY